MEHVITFSFSNFISQTLKLEERKSYFVKRAGRKVGAAQPYRVSSDFILKNKSQEPIPFIIFYGTVFTFLPQNFREIL